MNEQLLADMAERVKSRFYGKYRGTVTAVEAGTMRVKAMVPAVLGTQESGWALPCVPYAGPGVGIAFLPEVDSGVWIEFEGGDVSYPIWVGCYWRAGEVPAEAGEAAKVIVTKQVTMVLDDDGPGVTLSDSNGNEVTLDGTGVTLTRGGMSVAVETGRVTINGGAMEVT